MPRSSLILLATLNLFTPSWKLKAADRPPNVVVIFADDLGYADLACFGGKGMKTPNLDLMAKEGRRFTNFHVPQPVCSASRASLLTGCYANRVGIHGALGPNAKVGLSEKETTIAEVLKSRGYATGMAGKWHLGHHAQFLPTRQGFDEYFGLPYSNDMWPYHPEARSGTYPKLPLIEGEKTINGNVDAEAQAKLTTQYTERAVSFINRHKDQPFFFYLAHSMPHVPLFVSEKHAGKSGSGLYGDVILEIDWSVGQVLRALKENGLDDKTLVIFTSDNGPWLSYGNQGGSAGKYREGKGSCWEGGVRVPCVMRWPGEIPAGSTSDTMLMTIDLLPTIAKLAGAPMPARKIDGLDVWPIIHGDATAKNPHDAYWFYYEQNQLQAVMSGDGKWKLQLPHVYRTLSGRTGGKDGKPARYDQVKITTPELYNLQEDPQEKTSVAAQHPNVLKSMMAQAEKARAELGDSLTQRQGTGNREAGRIAE